MLGYSSGLILATLVMAFSQGFNLIARTSNDSVIKVAFPIAIVAIILVALVVAIVKRIFKVPTDIGFDKIQETIEKAGYKYDSKQGVFYSHMYPWQREYGYCRLYDESAAPMGMIIDAEPIYFEYEGKKWLVELWKGQYDLCCGCEVGVYNTAGPDLNIPGVFNGTFYHCVSDEERLNIKCTLYKKGKVYFKRNDLHWWITGFRLGEYAEPKDLKMDVSITFKNRAMRNAFIQGLKKAGYKEKEYKMVENVVSLTYDVPKSSQPFTRTEATDGLIQKKNKFMCDSYQKVTKPFKTLPEKFDAIRDMAPEIFDHIINMGKNKKFFDSGYNKIKDHVK